MTQARLPALSLLLAACRLDFAELAPECDPEHEQCPPGVGTGSGSSIGDGSTSSEGGIQTVTTADVTTDPLGGSGSESGDGATSGGEADDPPPWIDGLACDPAQASEVGPTVVTYTASPDAVEAELLDDGVVIATGSAGAPFIFPVTSAPHNNPGSTLSVVVRDAAGQTAEASIYQPSIVKEPGSTVWTTIEPDDGAFSTGGAVAVSGKNAIAAGVHWQNGQILAILRRYDKSGTWIGTEDGWAWKHTDWTQRDELKTGNLGLSGLTIDSTGDIYAAGTAQIGGEPRMYVARFGPNGGLIWEVLGAVGSEARGVGVTADRSIYVVGAVRVAKGPDVWDMATWVYGADKEAYGPDIFKDPMDKAPFTYSERGQAVVVLASDRVAVAGTREVQDPVTKDTFLRGVVLIYEGKGKRVGEWTSPGDKMLNDSILAAAPAPSGLVLCGYAQNDVDIPANKPQILIRWFDEDLTEVKAPRVEPTPGAATCHGVGTNMQGVTIVGATVNENQGGDNAWIFTVTDAGSPRVDYMKRNGISNGQDRVLGLACEYMCAWTGSEEVDGAAKWISGMLRG